MMSRPQKYIEGEALHSQHAKSNNALKLRVAVLVVCVLLVSALVVIYLCLVEYSSAVCHSATPLNSSANDGGRLAAAGEESVAGGTAQSGSTSGSEISRCYATA